MKKGEKKRKKTSKKERKKETFDFSQGLVLFLETIFVISCEHHLNITRD